MANDVNDQDVEVGFIEDQIALATYLSDPSAVGKPVRTYLQASDRVIARVTDGIYREPASALRELISNAWDADATQVTILTDAPRFGRVYVRDDGNGMSFDTLSHLVKNIGGSAKRSAKGEELGVTGDDVDKSPGGRQLIGKIGIGLFSISQLARRFRIVTKVKGQSYRLIAEISLRTYTEDGTELDHASAESDDEYISGIVEIVSQSVEDIDSHGTDLILEDVKPRVRDLLRDSDRWQQVFERERAEESGDRETAKAIRVQQPLFHSGWIGASSPGRASTVEVAPNLPWTEDTDPSERMAALMDAVEKQGGKKDRPDLAATLDSYLNMLWTLGLSAPVRYVDQHPFDLEASEKFDLYWISNEAKGQATQIKMHDGETVRQAVKTRGPGNKTLVDGLAQAGGGFRVFIDSVEIKHPVRFNYIPAGEKNLTKSLLFVGSYNPDLSKISADRRGGGLSLEGYAFWTGRIVPKENNGVLIRIRGASGATFDPTFFSYQVSELTRLRQITSEIFIQRGLDAALNIDRESFNFSHPHVQLVAGWVQRSVRQLTNKHKDLASKLRKERIGTKAAAEIGALDQFVRTVWSEKQSDDLPPEVTFADDIGVKSARGMGNVALHRTTLTSVKALQQMPGEQGASKVAALVQVLLAYDVLQGLEYSEQEELIAAILHVFYGVESK
ncbi:DNA mismatch repair protein MutL [Xanthomonas hydrangeae]|uniref:ATP-binding protein n=1 Tax=Xanthomonas hydrangeae TaxID=2775159 RepID=UPI001964B767|nr:DNA mismatch repair protein MutL [Xanthomonas hydrangeae]CAD7713578.1 DNA mismatch repair protein MutL [Xanthomonas hydrangeae]CAD7720333.1 DNA mismatch repair protein MutL [Xanthomonas hydrangeae]CAD7720337.1 DNA mismatch repair protein MutL [Xanthomonas hydrangeae]